MRDTEGENSTPAGYTPAELSIPPFSGATAASSAINPVATAGTGRDTDMSGTGSALPTIIAPTTTGNTVMPNASTQAYDARATELTLLSAQKMSQSTTSSIRHILGSSGALVPEHLLKEKAMGLKVTHDVSSNAHGQLERAKKELADYKRLPLLTVAQVAHSFHDRLDSDDTLAANPSSDPAEGSLPRAGNTRSTAGADNATPLGKSSTGKELSVTVTNDRAWSAPRTPSTPKTREHFQCLVL
ncbi:hypothetical protein BT63DRAFT_42046 [Microthyrium microscopicum]|uniref:Uncharacterized protein n=1 Tax=Microthyrium microscopicum TaxID=703497 RepID=A0A6A6UX58_9PEZI|nr:hypothetical protein BT63DRAFT_42046 [Microthyrium microscopicum]